MPRHLRLLCLALLLPALVPALLTACGNAGSRRETEVRLSLSEWKIDASAAEVKQGSVNFVAANQGAETHELLVVKSDAHSSDLPLVDGHVDEARVQIAGRLPAITPGFSQSLFLGLETGKYLLICNRTSSAGSHYVNGMAAGFFVAP
jgi:hypothetical protein